MSEKVEEYEEELEQEELEELNKSISWEWFNKVLIGVIVLWLANLLGLAWVENRGSFGDMFGAVNALFSGFAFVGVIYAILLQRKELKLQRIELRQTRKELEGQKKEMQLQNKTLSKQAFENTFFQLLTLHSDIIETVNSGRDKGRSAFSVFYRSFKSKMDIANKRSFDTEIDKIQLAYDEFYKSYDAELGHYFRSLYNIFKFINQSEIEHERLYTNLVRAQLSRNELLLLFYNCLSELGNEKFKPLVEKYALLKTVPKDALLNDKHLSLYDQSAFE